MTLSIEGSFQYNIVSDADLKITARKQEAYLTVLNGYKMVTIASKPGHKKSFLTMITTLCNVIRKLKKIAS